MILGQLIQNLLRRLQDFLDDFNKTRETVTRNLDPSYKSDQAF